MFEVWVENKLGQVSRVKVCGTEWMAEGSRKALAATGEYKSVWSRWVDAPPCNDPDAEVNLCSGDDMDDDVGEPPERSSIPPAALASYMRRNERGE